MTQTSVQQWLDQNQEFLNTRFKEIGALLNASNESILPESYSQSNAIAKQMKNPPALKVISQAFGLSVFEEFVLTMCAGYELDGKFAHAIDSSNYIDRKSVV